MELAKVLDVERTLENGHEDSRIIIEHHLIK